MPENDTNNIEVSIIIVNYNAGPHLSNCFESIEDSAGKFTYEIIVIDNASNDESLITLDNLKQHNHVHIIINNKNAGFAHACNQGIKRSKGRFFLFLNPDCILNRKALSTALETLQNDPKALMAGVLITNDDGSEQRGCRRTFPNLTGALAHFFKLNRIFPTRFQNFNLNDTPLPNTPCYVDAISGAFMLTKREIIEKVGYWDEKYFLHVEDLDWCKRIEIAGYAILFLPQAQIIHKKGACSQGRPYFVEWHKYRGMWRFYRKFESVADNLSTKDITVANGIAMMFLVQCILIFYRFVKKALIKLFRA